jgi:outer membrane receptor protein involved in Fe transport
MIGGLTLTVALAAGPAAAQTKPAGTEVGEIVVTGTRIRQPADTTTAAPLLTVDAQVITDRGFVQAGQLINDLTSIAPQVPEAAGSGSASGNGQTFPNLFGLGAGRTLTLVNGRRFVTSSSGLGDRVVDTNIIPIGLVSHLDVVQAGGAAVYGSDAIAGVINYVLKDKFEGLELDAQYGQSSRGDYPVPSLRATFGRNFFGGRANLAADLEYFKTDSLLDYDRPRSNLGRVTVANAANTSATDGIPSVRENLNTRFWEFNYNGLLFTPAPAPVPAFIFSQAGVPQQFNATGSGFIPYNLGVPGGIPFNSGGDGLPYQELASLYTGVERWNGNVLGHFDVTDHMKLSGELLYAHTKSSDPYQVLLSNTVLNGAATGAGAIPISRQNPFIPASVAAVLGPGGPPLNLSKAWAAGDLTPTREGTFETDTFRALISLDGDFSVGDKNYYYSLSASDAQTLGQQRAWGTWTTRFNNAVQAQKNAAGAIVCAINNDANPLNDDPACSPINPFGRGNVSQGARDYIDLRTGQDFLNNQEDFLATIGGDVFKLPAGMVKFSAGFEHRYEFSKFVPLSANQRGLTGSQVATVATRGAYHTNEVSAELQVPIISEAMALPFAKTVEFDGQYRRVENSIAGKEDVWGLGGRWEVVTGFTIRGSRSRNFRAPTLDQLFAPSSTALSNAGSDPCDFRFINSGPAVATRQANCLALFNGNPLYGTGGSGGAPVGASAATRLATFQDPSVNFNNALVTTGGNASLANEISDTTTYGIVFQPTFVPGLAVVIDRIEVELTNGLSAFTPQNFEETCFDSSPQPADICSTFSRDVTGAINTAKQTTFNAGHVRFRGETYNVNYRFPLSRFFGDAHEYGDVWLNLEATHTDLLETSVTGFDRSRSDGTVANPDWVTKFDAVYHRGPFRATYELFYLPEVKQTFTATIESTPTPVIGSNTRHSISASYDFADHYTVRAGIINLTDEEPSYPTRNYGDILGRQYFVGLRARF